MGSRQPERAIPDVRDVFQCTAPAKGPRILEESKGPSHHNNNSSHYSNQESPSGPFPKGLTDKGLTEKDLKHIERHLSMKKTIRKQLSRHLSKAFVEAELRPPPEAPPSETPPSSSNSPALEHPEPIKKPAFWKKLTIRSRSKR